MSATLPPVEELRRLLYTPVLSDVLDSFGLMRQALRPFVRTVLGLRTGRNKGTRAGGCLQEGSSIWRPALR